MNRRHLALWISGSSSLLLFVGLAWWLRDLQPSVLDLQLCFTPRTFGAVIHLWSPEQLARYRAHLPIDGVLIGAYGSFGALLAWRSTLFAAWRRSARDFAGSLALTAAAADLAEDLLHAWLTESPRFGVPIAYAAAGCSSVLKWAALLAFGIACAIAVAGRRDEP